jgi:hypothetical protein
MVVDDKGSGRCVERDSDVGRASSEFLPLVPTTLYTSGQLLCAFRIQYRLCLFGGNYVVHGAALWGIGGRKQAEI